MSLLLGIVFDVVYLSVGIVLLPLSAIRGRLGRTWDHLVRRAWRPPPTRSGVRRCAWFHGVSVGEVLAARRLVESFAELRPDWDIVVSASTRLGVEAAGRAFPGRTVVSFPLDFSFCARRALRRLRPDVVVIVEHDLWPNFLRLAKRAGAEIALVNARLSERSLARYRAVSRLRPWPPREMLLCTEDATSASRFVELGFPAARVHATGNLKFDNPSPPPPEGGRAALGWSEEDYVLVAASTHEGEEDAALGALAALRADGRAAVLLLAPRRTERSEAVAADVCRRGLELRRRSSGADASDARPDVFLLDTVGELAAFVALGDAVFVGGSLVPVGGHSVIEPAAHARAIVIGPHHFNAKGVVSRFRARDAIVVVDDAKGLTSAVLELAAHAERATALGENARALVAEGHGASERVAARLAEIARD